MLSKAEIPEFHTPFSTVGYLTYKRTYSRRLNEDNLLKSMDEGLTEEFPDTIMRVINACDKQLHCGFTRDEEDRQKFCI